VSATDRRRFLRGSVALVGLGLLSGCGLLPPQPAATTKVPRLGLLAPGSEQAYASRVAAIRAGLHDVGYIEGETLTMEYRYGDGANEAGLVDLARSLVDARVDLIVTAGSACIRPAMTATTTIPIVMVADNADPVSVGYVASLAHPGGNVTGLTGLSPEVTAKRLELLKEVVPSMTRVAVLRNPDSPDRDTLRAETEAAASALGVQLQALDIRKPEDIDRAFVAAVEGRSEGLVVLRDPVTNTNRPQIVALAAQHRLPAIYASDEFVRAGGLLFYGANVEGLYRRLGGYVDRILKGARPADLPVERASELDFIVNLKVAQAIGLTIPPSVLQQATEVIQ
jgi:putative ABC transport system substrate-binding protein